MTRFIHDQFAKQYLAELLAPFGKVETSKDIAAEVRQVDVLFVPSPQLTANIELLGLLGKIAQNPAILEPFRNPVTKKDILTCIGKLINTYEQLERQGSSSNNPLDDTPYLWILSPTASPDLLASCGATLDESQWMSGIYFLAEVFKTAIVVIHQLPRIPETLWLRVLGKGRVQQQAIEELRSLPVDNPWRDNAIQLVCNLLAILAARQKQQQDLESDDRELIMQLSPIYLDQLAAATEQGIEQGMERERRNTVESILQMRFGIIDPELSAIIEPLIRMSSAEFTPLLLQLSREEILSRFGNINNG